MKLLAVYITILLIAATLDGAAGPAPAAGVQPSLTGAALLDDWGNRMTMLGTSVGENALRTQIRTTIAQLAMFDALNAVVGGPYHPFAPTTVAGPGGSPEAAVIHAAYVVAVHEFPARLTVIQSAHDLQIAALAGDTQAIADGMETGRVAANAVLDARADDHRNDPDLLGYVPASGPGAWSPTPPLFGAPQTPFLAHVTPFGYDDPARFRPAPPPDLDSRTYAADYNEIKDVGQSTSPTRTSEQSATAQFWNPSATALWSGNVRSLAAAMDFLTAARFEAIGIAAVTNALIAVWDAKYAYMFWRPVTAIRHGDGDGNDDTVADPEWTPFITTPSHPEYPAAHTTVGGGALGFYTVWFDTDQLALQVKGAGNAIRLYSSAIEVQAEEGNARVWGGMHFRNSTEVGTSLGSRVGKYTATHLLKRLDD